MRNLEDSLYYPLLPAGIESAGSMQKISIFLIMELARNGGDFGIARERIKSMISRGTLPDAIDEAVDSYVREYGDPDPAKEATKISNLAVFLRMSFAKWISTQFGPDASLAYLNAMSSKIILSEEGMAEGLGGLNCAIMDRANIRFPSLGELHRASSLCPEMASVVNIVSGGEARLCCISAEPGASGLEFKKKVVRVGGYECQGSLEQPEVHFILVKHLHILESTPIPEEGWCE
jgi:hypothetical protein